MSVNVLLNGKIVKLAGAVESDVIDQAVELATKQAVATAAAYADTIVAQAGGFHTKQVDRLPLGSLDPDDEEAIMPNTLYVVPNALGLAEGKRIEDTFMYIGDKWVQITNAIISRDNISKEFNDELTAIYNAIGETNDKELYSITKRIYNEAADAAYKQKEDGTIVTIGEAIGALEQFVEDLDPITGEEVKAEFEKTTA